MSVPRSLIELIVAGALFLAPPAGCGEGLLSGGYRGPSPDLGQQLDGGDAVESADARPLSRPCPLVEIHAADAGGKVTVRAEPSHTGEPAGELADGTVASVRFASRGVDELDDTTWLWVESTKVSGYVSRDEARCTTEEEHEKADPPFDGFHLPFVCRKKVRVSQGNNTAFSHNGASKYAFDFSVPTGTKVVAMAKGKVSRVYNKTCPGDPCYSGGGPSCVTRANLVWIKHPDKTQTIYAHLSRVKVSLRQKVAQGQVIGLSGSTGYSTGPHLHVGRMRSCCQTIPLKFKEVPGGVPKTGDRVVSRNCP